MQFSLSDEGGGERVVCVCCDAGWGRGTGEIWGKTNECKTYVCVVSLLFSVVSLL